MTRRLIETVDGLSEVMHTASDGTWALERVMDVEAAVEANKRAAIDRPDGMSPTRDWQHVASVPAVVWLDWVTRFAGGDERVLMKDDALLKRLLDDPDNRFFRTNEGLV